MDVKIINDKDFTIFPPKERMDSLYGRAKEETLGSMLIRRNNLIINLFRNIEDLEVELYGRAESPMIVLDRRQKLSAYIHNQQLHFIDMTKNDRHKIVETVKINFQNSVDPSFLIKFLATYQQEEWGDFVKRMFGKKYYADDVMYNNDDTDEA